MTEIVILIACYNCTLSIYVNVLKIFLKLFVQRN